MRWDAKRVSDPNLTLAEDGLAASNAKGSWHVVVGDEFLSEGVYDVEISTECDNLSLYVGVCAPGYWEECENAKAEGEEPPPPRDSKHCICMHGDGRCFIRGMEKDCKSRPRSRAVASL